jgi:hypothetical protein
MPTEKELQKKKKKDDDSSSNDDSESITADLILSFVRLMTDRHHFFFLQF